MGVAVGKNLPHEKKLRCLRVAPEYRSRGIGHHLIERILVGVGCDKPLVTVPEEMMHDLARPFVNDFHFDLTFVERGLYRQGMLEYVFNQER